MTQIIDFPKDRITVDALKHYVPYFHLGDQAKQKLEKSVGLTARETNILEAQIILRQIAIDQIALLSLPLIKRELKKLIDNSHIKHQEGLFNTLYVAGINGMEKGLRHFDVEKMKKSSTNYLFQWITTYAKKELNSLEAPLGIPPSKFQRFKKISAVRKKMEHSLGRKVTNEEVHEFFATGKADLKTMNGRVGSSDKPSQANLNITLDAIVEQQEFEKNLNEYQLFDPIDDYTADAQFSQYDEIPFYETIFGVFLELYNFTEPARYVLMSELKTEYKKHIDEIDFGKTTYKIVLSAWKELLKDPSGIFYDFLIQIKDSEFEQFDVSSLLSVMKQSEENANKTKYLILFEDKNIKQIKSGL